MKINEFMAIPRFGKKKLSVALFLTDGHVFLAVTPTGSEHYDLPKGTNAVGESLKDTLVREIEEETGLDISKYKSQLEGVGRFAYRPDKEIYIYYLKLDKLPPTSTMKCTSMFDFKGSRLPEVDGYFYVPYDNLHNFLPEMRRIIQSVLVWSAIK